MAFGRTDFICYRAIEELAQTLIIVANGGIGNQLFSLAASLHIAEKRKRRILFFSDNQHFVEILRQTQKTYWRQKRIIAISGRSTHKIINQIIDKAERNNPFKTIFSGLFNSRIISVSEPWSFPSFLADNDEKTPLVIRGYFQDIEMINNLSEENQKFLEFLITQKKNEQKQQVYEFPTLIGVHIRRGDHSQIAEYGVLSMSYFIDLIHSVMTPNAIIKISSDDFLVLTDLQAKLDCQILSPEKYDALKTMRILSEVKIFIMSNSTFSFWIGWAVNRRDGRVVAPDPWFKDVRVPSDYLYLSNFEKKKAVFSSL